MNKALSLIGLATKAGKVITGTEMCEKNLGNDKIKLLIVSCDASDSTKKQLSDKCTYLNKKHIEFSTKAELGKYTGKEQRAVIGITDLGFANKLLEIIEGGEC